jgi:hypothetical protein
MPGHASANLLGIEIFSRPDFTVGTGVSPVRFRMLHDGDSEVAGYTASGESHPAPKIIFKLPLFRRLSQFTLTGFSIYDCGPDPRTIPRTSRYSAITDSIARSKAGMSSTHLAGVSSSGLAMASTRALPSAASSASTLSRANSRPSGSLPGIA